MTDTVNDDRGNEEFDNAFAEFASGVEPEQSQHTDDDDTEEVDSSEDAAEEEVVSEGDDEVEQLRQKLESLQKERDDLDHAYKSQVGRVSALQKKIDTELKPVPKQEETSNDEDGISAVLADYPEIAGPIIKHLEKKYGAINSEIDKRLAPIQQQEQQRYIESQLSYMDAHHPGWKDKTNSQEYYDWLKEQPQAIQQMDSTMHAKEMEYLVKNFDLSRTAATKDKANEIVERRQQKLAANETIKSKGESKKSSAPDDFDSAWKFYAQKR